MSYSEPFYSNYDMYETEGVNGKATGGPGTGFYSNMSKYKSVMDFRNQKSKGRKKLLKKLLKKAFVKNAIDFESDNNISETEILGDSGSVADSNPFGGQLDDYTQETDENSTEPTSLDYAENLDINEPNDPTENVSPERNGAEPGFLGSQETFNGSDELDAEKYLNMGSSDGITESGTTSYQHLW